MKISTILDQIDLGSMALPEFQRGYVWNRDQVRGLMHSLYHKHPVGSLLVWVTKTESADTRGAGHLSPGSVKLILDGQQRVTSLYGIVRSRPPRFFDGNVQTFTGLYFNLEQESFEFYAPMKMKGDPLWIDVSELMRVGVGGFIQKLIPIPSMQAKLNIYINRLNAIHGIKDIDLHIEEVTGEDKTIDVVVEIFNKVNSGGTKLSKGDLALARICATWPEARNEMKARLEKWRSSGFDFRLDWQLRCINTIVTGEALFSALKDVDTRRFQDGLFQTEKAVDYLLNLISGRLGLDHDRVLGSRYSFPLMVRYLVQREGHLADYRERDRLLYWYIHTFLWGRYAGATETKLNQDLALIEEEEGALERLIAQLRQERGSLEIRAEDFQGWSLGARFYPMLYMLTRVWHSNDWDSGIELSNHLLGKRSTLQIHHIFPKALLYKHGYGRTDVNAIANYAFLTQETNLKISDRAPEDYFEEIMAKQPGALESHWVPMNRVLWKPENYPMFLAARREMLAQAANEFLDSLLTGQVPDKQVTVPVLERGVVARVPGSIESEDEEQLLLETNVWVEEQGLPEGEFMFELLDQSTRQPLAILDLAWPHGLQEGLSTPVALLLNESPETGEIANRAGFLFFTDVEAFRDYVRREVLAFETVVP